jgi:hypothetical protein
MPSLITIHTRFDESANDQVQRIYNEENKSQPKKVNMVNQNEGGGNPQQ